MVDPHEEPDPDLISGPLGDESPLEAARLDARLRESGLTWPRTDQELDTWLASQALDPGEEEWLREVVKRRMQEAQGVGGGSAPASIGTPVGEADDALPGKSIGHQAAPAPRPRARRLSAADLAQLDRQLLELVESGVSLPDGLAAYTHELQAGRLSGVVESLRADLEAGHPLSQAMARQGDALPPLYRALVAAGEAGGDLAGCLLLLHEQAEVEAEAGRRLRESLFYPAMSLTLTIGGLVFLAAAELPQFARVFDGMGIQLPWMTVAVLEVSQQLRSPVTWAALLVGAPLALHGLRVGARRLAPRLIGGLLDGRLRERSLAELSRSLAGLLQRGVPLPSAFGALRAAWADRFPPGALDQVQARLEGGATLGAALRPEAVFPRTYVWLVGAAEARGGLPDALEELARRYERRVQARLRVFETLVGPLVLAGVGLLVLLVVLSVFLPIFELQKQLQQ